MKLIMQVLIAFLLISAAGQSVAFRSTDVESYTDPDFEGYQVSKVVVMVDSDSNETRQRIETGLAKALKKYDVEVVPFRELFPPTRDWTQADIATILEEKDISAQLLVTPGQSSSQVFQFSSNTNTTTNTSGRISGNRFDATTNTQSTSTPIYGAKSKAQFSAVMYNPTGDRTVWYADITVKAGGTLFVGEKGDAKGAVGAIVKALFSDGHVAKKSKKKVDRR